MSNWGFVTHVDSYNITLLFPKPSSRLRPVNPALQESTSPVNPKYPSPELSSYRAATTTHAYFTATRDTPLTTSLFYSSCPPFSPAPTLLICFSCTHSSRTQDPPFLSNSALLQVTLHHDSALDPTAPIASLAVPALPSSRTSFLRVALRLEQAPSFPSSLPRSRSRTPEHARTAPPLPRPLSPRQDADHVTIRAETARVAALIQGETPSKPRSRRCFVCGQRNTHALSFRFCPRTRTLLRRQLAKLDSGRLVLPDGSPLPMTRHAGGVAGHLISLSNTALRVPEHPTTTAPSVHVLPRSTHPTPRTKLHFPPTLRRFEPADHDEPT
ncbi:hypothetical protein GGX14DRAFT_574991 [Mycena pura]|uniref:Uncharacterized protein n=1 Tax=Mycena pura TaxID=153505 RepID=A0AAD6UW30_9AGAR|nr:hypothetical protein GGX14DRAFT_574991 [Mycena pura]